MQNLPHAGRDGPETPHAARPDRAQPCTVSMHTVSLSMPHYRLRLRPKAVRPGAALAARRPPKTNLHHPHPLAFGGNLFGAGQPAAIASGGAGPGAR